MENPGAAAIGAGVLALVASMYLGRAPAHAAISSLCSALQRTVQTLADALHGAVDRLLERNRRVLLELGREETERSIALEFKRVQDLVASDLSRYPALHRRISDQIARIEKDYRASSECPPAPTEWVKAVKMIADLPTRDDSAVGRILGEIQQALEDGQAEALQEHRQASRKRHALLGRMLPVWRQLQRTLERVNATIGGLEERSRSIDRHMQVYQEILANSDEAAQRLSASRFTRFVSSGLVLLVALLGGLVNFQLIALPMSEMVGGNSYVGPFQMSGIAALVLILTEVAMGLFLMDAARITRLFPVMAALDDRMRRRIAWAAFGLLVSLACVESSLAYMRDLLAADREALAQSLIGAQALEAEFRWIPAVGQMVLGFVLPFALAFAAIPLESFIQSSRMVAGTLCALGLRTLAVLVGLAAPLTQHLGSLLRSLYDVAIMVPLGIERLLRKPGTGAVDTRAQGAAS